jgi:UDP:flavonoid glycosyltransferase YjiC (YdhE family)
VSPGSGDIFLISDAPHDWLFPRCCALVHHGGVGTVAAGLRHGRPCLIVAAFGDLFFWGDVCHSIGVSPPVIPLKGIASGQLAAGMRALLSRPHYAAAAQRVAVRLQQEDGLSAAVASVHATLAAADARRSAAGS